MDEMSMSAQGGNQFRSVGQVKRRGTMMHLFLTFLHCKITVAEIRSADVVVISTFLLANPRGKALELLQKLRKVHYHRIFLDESHLNNSSSRSADNSTDTNSTRLLKQGLGQLSSTHRYCVTGTPVGQSLVDLFGQLRFMRVQQFCRNDFWKQCIESPYGQHNVYALTVLRSLLSHIVIRHSKEQTIGPNGDALLELPPRKVETLLLPFATEAEKKIYEVSDCCSFS